MIPSSKNKKTLSRSARGTPAADDFFLLFTVIIIFISYNRSFIDDHKNIRYAFGIIYYIIAIDGERKISNKRKI